MKIAKFLLLVAGTFTVGAVLGGYLFSKSLPRSVIAFNQCENCMSPKDLAGLLASVGIQRLPRLLPRVVVETDKNIAIEYPLREEKILAHYLVIPKKDIKNVGTISPSDSLYIVDAFFVAQELIKQHKMLNYQILTNGPGLQDVTYLHFHLIEHQVVE
jgi:hypothetical protein